MNFSEHKGSEYNSKLWNSTTDDKSPERDQARKQKRRLHYISNIYVIQDQANPSTEGRVFLYKYGKKIFNKITEAMEPQFADEVAKNPFDLWEGANFKLKIRQVEGYRNYDKSEFERPGGPLDASDEKMEQLWKSEYSLQEFLVPSNFKSYDELKAKLVRVLAGPTDPIAARKALDEELPWNEPKTKSAPTHRAAASKPAPEAAAGGDDDSLEFFRKLADE